MRKIIVNFLLLYCLCCWAQESFNNPSVKEFVVNNVKFSMIKVAGGTFAMGGTQGQGSDAWDDEMPIHTMTVEDFYIGQTEVTQELWLAVMGNNPSWETGNLQNPVERVSWDDCQAFILKLNKLTGQNFRLPTEHEWEYAARGGQNAQDCKYAGSNSLDDVGWYAMNSNNHARPVAQKDANELGLYDMSGNVWEWCQSVYGIYGLPHVNSGQLFVYRGGSWFCVPWKCRVSFRNFARPDFKYADLGLRLAL